MPDLKEVCRADAGSRGEASAGRPDHTGGPRRGRVAAVRPPDRAVGSAPAITFGPRRLRNLIAHVSTRRCCAQVLRGISVPNPAKTSGLSNSDKMGGIRLVLLSGLCTFVVARRGTQRRVRRTRAGPLVGGGSRGPAKREGVARRLAAAFPGSGGRGSPSGGSGGLAGAWRSPRADTGTVGQPPRCTPPPLPPPGTGPRPCPPHNRTRSVTPSGDSPAFTWHRVSPCPRTSVDTRCRLAALRVGLALPRHCRGVGPVGREFSQFGVRV